MGRTLELASLEALLRRVEAGQGQVVSVVGEPGMGKTRLLHEFTQRLEPARVTVLTGRCVATGQATPYLPIRALLQHACGLAERVPLTVMTAQVHQQLQGLGLAPTEEAPYLLHVLEVPDVMVPLADLSPQTIRWRTFAALHKLFLRRSQRQPLVIIVENLHWSDPTSQAYVTELVERMAGMRLLLLVTCRPGYRPPWIDKSYATQLTLAPLSPEDSRQVVQAVMHPAPCAEPVLQAMVAKAAGNPLFLEELAWGVREQGTLPVEVPATVQAMLAARMDRLPPEAKTLLQTAAVIGAEVPLALLQAITEGAGEALHQGLRHLQATEFLYETQVVPELTYTFKHALTHEVAYSSLLQERRRMLHARIVATLERCTGEQRAAHVEILAHHTLGGEMWDKALAYCRQAGEKALARSAYREAAGYLEQALEALSHLPESRARCEQAIDLRLDLRSALWRLGDWGQVLACMREAEALAERLGDQRRLAHVLQTMADNCRILGDYEQAFLAGQRALTFARALGDRPLQSEVRTTLGQLYYRLGDYGRAIELLQQAVTCLPSEPTPEYGNASYALWVWPYSWLLLCLAQMGAFTAGETTRIDILQRAEASERPLDRVVASYGVGLFCLRQGALLQAITLFERGLAVCHTSEIRDWVVTLTATLGYAYTLSGRLSEALPLLEQAVAQDTAMRGGFLSPAFVVWWSEALLLAGCLEKAMELARRALDFSRAYQERGNEAHALWLLGAIAAHLEPPQAEQAEAYYRQALALAEALGMFPLQAHCHLGLGTLYAQTGQVEQARTTLSMALALYQTMAMTFWLPRVEEGLAQVDAS